MVYLLWVYFSLKGVPFYARIPECFIIIPFPLVLTVIRQHPEASLRSSSTTHTSLLLLHKSSHTPTRRPSNSNYSTTPWTPSSSSKMFSFNVNAPVFIPKVGLPIFNDGQLSAVRILDCDEYFTEFLQEFNPKDVADEDLFNPAVFPVSARDHEELAAAEAFNREMAELEFLEHQEELRSLLQDRIAAVRHVSGQTRPAKITSMNGGVFSPGGSRGTQPIELKGKMRMIPPKKCRHNINQPRPGGNYY